ncbi:MAG TPA: hypothetical protein DCX54_12930 [Flavobacteriales bacterium]|nr:hypothetical protein [Flavobacteriales bacterium]
MSEGKAKTTQPVDSRFQNPDSRFKIQDYSIVFIFKGIREPHFIRFPDYRCGPGQEQIDIGVSTTQNTRGLLFSKSHKGFKGSWKR